MGLSQASAYDHRRRWPAFAEHWDAAVEQGYNRLATAPAASGAAMLGDTEVVPDPVLGPISVGEALQPLRLHRPRVDGVGRAPGRARRMRTWQEVEPSILAKFELFERAEQAAMTPAQRAARERELAAMGGGERGS